MRVTQIVIRPPASFLGTPCASPAQHFASHVGVELPLLFFFFLIVDGNIELPAHIVRWVH